MRHRLRWVPYSSSALAYSLLANGTATACLKPRDAAGRGVMRGCLQKGAVFTRVQIDPEIMCPPANVLPFLLVAVLIQSRQ